MKAKQREEAKLKHARGTGGHNDSHHEEFNHPNLEVSGHRTPNLEPQRIMQSKSERFVKWFKQLDNKFIKPKLIYKYTTEEEFKKIKNKDLV